jgi:ligand-binding SRPBCC domain-containing protein
LKEIVLENEFPVSVETLFNFHRETANLSKITPPWIGVKILNQIPITNQGDLIELQISQYGVSQLWRIEIEEMVEPNLIIDYAQKSPFKLFRHRREFRESENGSILKDIVSLQMPIFLRPIEFIAQKETTKMFQWRHKKLGEIFGGVK